MAVSISGGFGMDALLIKTGGLLLIVALGYLLKRRGVFQQGACNRDALLLAAGNGHAALTQNGFVT